MGLSQALTVFYSLSENAAGQKRTEQRNCAAFVPRRSPFGQARWNRPLLDTKRVDDVLARARRVGGDKS